MRSIICSLAVLIGCTGTPTPTGTVCADPDPMTLGYTLDSTPGCTGSLADCNFGKTFMDTYCINCHAAALPHSKRNGAPIYHDFDTLLGVLEVPDHIDQQTGFGPKAQNDFMPGAGTGGRCPSIAGGKLDEDCPQPTAQEREKLSQWIACERKRPHTF